MKVTTAGYRRILTLKYIRPDLSITYLETWISTGSNYQMRVVQVTEQYFKELLQHYTRIIYQSYNPELV